MGTYTDVVPSKARRPFLRRRAALLAPLSAGLLVLTACGSAEPEASATADTEPAECEEVALVNSIRSLSNAYHADWAQGGEFFAESVGMSDSYQVIANEGDSQQQLSTIRQILAENGRCTVLNIDPNESAITEAIIDAVEEAGAYAVTQWNRPDDLTPDGYDHWISHIGFRGEEGGYAIAVELFEAMGGSGSVVAVQGILDNVSAKERFTGLEQALEEYPEITLLDAQPADWDRTKAQDLTQTWLTQYGDEIAGVWAADDGMGLGALEALRAAGKAGSVPVVGVAATAEALEAVKAGEFAATASFDAFWQGGIGLAMGLAALQGDVDVSELTEAQRLCIGQQIPINKDNVDDFLTAPTGEDYDWSDPFARCAA